MGAILGPMRAASVAMPCEANVYLVPNMSVGFCNAPEGNDPVIQDADGIICVSDETDAEVEEIVCDDVPQDIRGGPCHCPKGPCELFATVVRFEVFRRVLSNCSEKKLNF